MRPLDRIKSLVIPEPPSLRRVTVPALAPVPHTNGNGRLQTKSFTLTMPGGDFFPVDGNGNTLDRDFLAVLGGGGAYATSVLCYAAMRYRAVKLAEAPLMVVQENDDGEQEWLKDHPLAELLQYPNDDEEMADLIEQLSLSLDATGMGLFVKDLDGGDRPGRLTFFTGNEFTVAPTDDRIYGEFTVNASGLERLDLDLQPRLPPERVVFFRIPRPGDRWSGLGPLQVVARQLRIEEQLLTSMVNAIPNTVVPSMTVLLNDGTTSQQVQEFADINRMAYASARNHGKPWTAADVKQVMQNKLGFEGLAGGALWREIESAMCVAFQVRPEVLAMMIGMENAPWSHMSIAQRMAYDEGIIPTWRRIARSLTRQLLRPTDDTPDRSIQFDTSDIRALQADLDAAAKRQLDLKAIATKNERRAIAGMDPVEGDPEWDEVEVPAPMPVPGAPGEEPPANGAKLSAKSAPDAHLTWAIFNIETKASQRTWEDDVAKLLQAQETDILRIYDKYAAAGGMARVAVAGAKAVDLGIISSFLSEVAGYLRRLGAAKARSALGPTVWGTVQASGRKMANRFGFDFDVVQPGMQRYAAEETAFLVRAMGETTGEQVAKAVQDSIEASESAVDLRKRLQELPAFNRERAQLVARTETTRATNGAQRRTMSEYQAKTSNTVEKAWISSRDDRVRDEHQELDNGEFIPVDAAFANGLTEPGEPNCRCTLGYRIAQEA